MNSGSCTHEWETRWGCQKCTRCNMRIGRHQARPESGCVSPNNILKPQPKRWHVNVVLRFGSFWMGCHFSRRHKSICIAPLPCVVIRIARTPYTTPEPGGIVL